MCPLEDINSSEDKKVKQEQETSDINKHCNYSLWAAFAILVILEVLFFRSVIFNDYSIGEFSDARLNNVITEHWFRVITGKDALAQMRHFYPASGVLFKTDMLLGFAPIYCLVRLLGANLFLAYKITLIFFHFAGALGMFYFLRYQLKIDLVIALIGVTISSFACNYSIRLDCGHTQILALSFVPFILICWYKYFAATKFSENQKDKVPFRLFWGLAAVALIALNFYTGFYSAFYLYLFCLITMGSFTVIFIGNFGSIWPLVQYVKNYWKDYILFSISLVLMLAPFLIGYLPALNRYSRLWVEIIYRILRPIDIINVSPDNVLYGNIISLLNLRNVTSWAELETGLPLVTLSLLTFLSVIIFSKKFKLLWLNNKQNIDNNDNKNNKEDIQNKANRSSEKLWQYCLLAAAAVSIFISFLLIIRIGDYSLWWLVYKFVPGAKAVRMVSRYMVFLDIPIAITTAVALNSLKNAKQFIFKLRYNCGVIAVALFCLIAFENLHSVDYITRWDTSHWDIRSSTAFLDSVANPGKNCRSFFIVDPANSNKSWKQHIKQIDSQLSAMFISQKYNIDTLNGYVNNPDKWYLSEPESPIYKNQVISWVDRNKIDVNTLYAYSLSHNTWLDYPSWCKGRIVIPCDSPKYQLSPQCNHFENKLDLPEAIVCYPKGIVLGPDIALKNGNYLVTVTGRDLDKCGFSIYSKDKKDNFNSLDFAVVKKESAECIMSLKLDKDAEKIGVSVRNKKAAYCLIFNMSFEEDKK